MNLALNPFDAGKKPESIENLVVTDRVKEFMQMYEKWRDVLKYIDLRDECSVMMNLLNGHSTEVYNKNEITVLSKQISYYGDDFGGAMVSALMRRAKKNGIDEFYLVVDKPLPYLCAWTHNVKVTVDGDVGSHFGYGSENSDFRLKGNAAELFANHSTDCKFYVDGNVTSLFGDVARGCDFEVTGDVSSYLAFASHCSGNTLVLRDTEANKDFKDFKWQNSSKVKVIFK